MLTVYSWHSLDSCCTASVLGYLSAPVDRKPSGHKSNSSNAKRFCLIWPSLQPQQMILNRQPDGLCQWSLGCFKLDSPNFTSSWVPPFHILLLLLFSFRGPYCNKGRVVVSFRLFFEIHSTKWKQRTKKRMILLCLALSQQTWMTWNIQRRLIIWLLMTCHYSIDKLW